MEGKVVMILTIISISMVVRSETRVVNAHKHVGRKMVLNALTHSNTKDNVYIHARAHAHAHAHVYDHPRQMPEPTNTIVGADATKIVNELCATATYKDACIKSLTSLANNNNNNPPELFRSGVKLALEEVTKASNLPTTLLPQANTKRASSAIKSCKDLLEQSIDRLKMASEQVGGANLITVLKDPVVVMNLRLELGDVNTFSTNCLDEFGEAEAPQLQSLMRDGINNAKELAVNMLDIVSTYNF